ncbi:9860_t:CDS:2 [Entrophospora sp. SA101]|nr:9860_t:CDS:2 [Entrophospora sp. SA101]
MTFLTNGNLLLIEERFNYKDLKIHILTFKSTCDSNNNVHFRAIYKTSYNIISPATINNRPNVFLNSRKMLIDYKDLFTTQIDNVTMTFENHYYLLRPCFIIKKLIYSKDECIVAIKLCHEIVVCSIEYGIVVSSARFKEETIKDIEFIYSKDNVEHLFAILINKQSNEITYKLFDPYDLNNYTCITDIFNGSTAAGDNKNETNEGGDGEGEGKEKAVIKESKITNNHLKHFNNIGSIFKMIIKEINEVHEKLTKEDYEEYEDEDKNNEKKKEKRVELVQDSIKWLLNYSYNDNKIYLKFINYVNFDDNGGGLNQAKPKPKRKPVKPFRDLLINNILNSKNVPSFIKYGKLILQYSIIHDKEVIIEAIIETCLSIFKSNYKSNLGLLSLITLKLSILEANYPLIVDKFYNQISIILDPSFNNNVPYSKSNLINGYNKDFVIYENSSLWNLYYKLYFNYYKRIVEHIENHNENILNNHIDNIRNYDNNNHNSTQLTLSSFSREKLRYSSLALVIPLPRFTSHSSENCSPFKEIFYKPESNSFNHLNWHHYASSFQR